MEFGTDDNYLRVISDFEHTSYRINPACISQIEARGILLLLHDREKHVGKPRPILK